jgi:hypothetical protein
MNVWELQREGTRRLIVFPLPTDRRLWAAACCLLHNEQNGKRLAARPGSACAWVRGHGRGRMDGWAGSRNRRTAAGGTARCEPPSRPCDQWTAPPPYGPLQTGGLVRRTVSVREHASSNSYRLIWGRLAWAWGGGGGVFFFAPVGSHKTCFPSVPASGRNCQIPHSAAAHLGTLQHVTALLG